MEAVMNGSSKTVLIAAMILFVVVVAVGQLSASVTERVSVSSGGVQGNSFSRNPSISADGRFVAFESDASDLVLGDTNNVRDIFVRDRVTGLTERVSVSSGGVQGNNGSSTPSISADGRFVAFNSTAGNLVFGDTNNLQDIFVHDTGPHTSEFGVFRQGTWALDQNGNGAWNPGADKTISFGIATDKPVVGDWAGLGRETVGVFRSGTWVLDFNGNGIWDGAVTDRLFTFGLATDIPVTGDWSGNGRTKIGVFRNGTWVLDFNGNGKWDGPVTDRLFTFGVATDIPVTGDWNRDGKTEIGVYRNGAWVLDMNRNGLWDDTLVDKVRSFGLPTDKPVTGIW